MTPTLAPVAHAAGPSLIGWADVTERFWRGMGLGICVAWERRFGPVTLIVYRDAHYWWCRCGLWASRRLEAADLDDARDEAAAVLRDVVSKVMEAM